MPNFVKISVAVPLPKFSYLLLEPVLHVWVQLLWSYLGSKGLMHSLDSCLYTCVFVGWLPFNGGVSSESRETEK